MEEQSHVVTASKSMESVLREAQRNFLAKRDDLSAKLAKVEAIKLDSTVSEKDKKDPATLAKDLEATPKTSPKKYEESSLSKGIDKTKEWLYSPVDPTVAAKKDEMTESLKASSGDNPEKKDDHAPEAASNKAAKEALTLDSPLTGEGATRKLMAAGHEQEGIETGTADAPIEKRIVTANSSLADKNLTAQEADMEAKGGAKGVRSEAEDTVRRVQEADKKIEQAARGMPMDSGAFSKGTVDKLDDSSPYYEKQKQLKDEIDNRNKIVEEACSSPSVCRAVTNVAGVKREVTTSDLAVQGVGVRSAAERQNDEMYKLNDNAGIGLKQISKPSAEKAIEEDHVQSLAAARSAVEESQKRANDLTASSASAERLKESDAVSLTRVQSTIAKVESQQNEFITTNAVAAGAVLKNSNGDQATTDKINDALRADDSHNRTMGGVVGMLPGAAGYEAYKASGDADNAAAQVPLAGNSLKASQAAAEANKDFEGKFNGAVVSAGMAAAPGGSMTGELVAKGATSFAEHTGVRAAESAAVRSAAVDVERASVREAESAGARIAESAPVPHTEYTAPVVREEPLARVAEPEVSKPVVTEAPKAPEPVPAASAKAAAENAKYAKVTTAETAASKESSSALRKPSPISAPETTAMATLNSDLKEVNRSSKKEVNATTAKNAAPATPVSAPEEVIVRPAYKVENTTVVPSRLPEEPVPVRAAKAEPVSPTATTSAKAPEPVNYTTEPAARVNASSTQAEPEYVASRPEPSTPSSRPRVSVSRAETPSPDFSSSSFLSESSGSGAARSVDPVRASARPAPSPVAQVERTQLSAPAPAMRRSEELVSSRIDTGRAPEPVARNNPNPDRAPAYSPAPAPRERISAPEPERISHSAPAQRADGIANTAAPESDFFKPETRPLAKRDGKPEAPVSTSIREAEPASAKGITKTTPGEMADSAPKKKVVNISDYSLKKKVQASLANEEEKAAVMDGEKKGFLERQKDRFKEAGTKIKEQFVGKGVLEEEAEALAKKKPRRLAEVPDDHPSVDQNALLEKVGEKHGVLTDRLPKEDEAAGTWQNRKNTVSLREDYTVAEKASDGHAFVIHETKHMATNTGGQVERQAAFRSASGEIFEGSQKGYSKYSRADEPDARGKQLASYRLRIQRGEQKLADLAKEEKSLKSKEGKAAKNYHKEYFDIKIRENAIRKELNKVRAQEKHFLAESRKMIARERVLNEGALKSLADPNIHMIVEQERILSAQDKFEYKFVDSKGVEQTHKDLVPSYKGLSSDQRLALQTQDFEKSLAKKFGEDSDAVKSFTSTDMAKNRPTLNIEREAVAERIERPFTVPTGVGDIERTGYFEPKSLGGRKDAIATIDQRMKQLDALDAHLTKHYGPSPVKTSASLESQGPRDLRAASKRGDFLTQDYGSALEKTARAEGYVKVNSMDGHSFQKPVIGPKNNAGLEAKVQIYSNETKQSRVIEGVVVRDGKGGGFVLRDNAGEEHFISAGASARNGKEEIESVYMRTPRTELDPAVKIEVADTVREINPKSASVRKREPKPDFGSYKDIDMDEVYQTKFAKADEAKSVHGKEFGSYDDINLGEVHPGFKNAEESEATKIVGADHAGEGMPNAQKPWSEEIRKEKTTAYREQMEQNHKAPSVARSDSIPDPSRKWKHLEAEHPEFKKINAEDNKAAIKLISENDPAVKRVASMQAAVGKPLNDVVVQNKDKVNQLFNLQKSLIWDKVSQDELLSKHLVGKYSDFNNVKLLFNSNSAAIDTKLKNIFTEYNARYSEYLEKVAKAEGWDKKAMGLAEKRENWHHLGIGNTADEANLAARKSREMLDNGLSRPRTYEEVEHLVKKDLEAIETKRIELENKFGNTKGMFVGESGDKVLSAEASEAIRKAEQSNAGIKKVLENQFSTKLTDSEVTSLREYAAKADSFSPDLYVAERIDVPLDARRNGIVSVDFKGQNARNLEETMKAMVANRGKAIEQQVKAIREGEQEATKMLEAKKADFRAAIEKQFKDSDPHWAEHVYFTGDDGIYLPAKKLTAEEKGSLAGKLGEKPDSMRLTYGESHFTDNGKPIPRNAPYGEKALSDFVVDAEKVEKDLRKGLMSEFKRDITNNTQVVVDMTPRSDGTKSIGVYVGGKHSAQQLGEIKAWAHNFLKERGDDLSFVKELREPHAPQQGRSLAEAPVVTKVSPELESLRKIAPDLKKDFSNSHQVRIENGKGYVKIGKLEKDKDAPFMKSLYKAIKGGHIAEIDAGGIAGPKVLNMLTKAGEIAPKGTEMIVKGKIAVSTIEEIFGIETKLSKNPAAAGWTVEKLKKEGHFWTENDIADFKAAKEKLRLKEACAEQLGATSLEKCGQITFQMSTLDSAAPATASKPGNGPGLTMVTDLKTGNSSIIAPSGAQVVREAPMSTELSGKRDRWLSSGQSSDLEDYGSSVPSSEAKSEFKRLADLRAPANMPVSPGAAYYQQQVNYTRAQLQLVTNFDNEEVFGGLEKAMEQQFKLEKDLKQYEQALKNARANGKP